MPTMSDKLPACRGFKARGCLASSWQISVAGITEFVLPRRAPAFIELTTPGSDKLAACRTSGQISKTFFLLTPSYLQSILS